jgi:hypothetical protein
LEKRPRKPIPWGLIAALALGCAAPEPSPEVEIREAVHEILAAIEEGKPEAVLQHVAFEYRGDDGLGYPEIQSLVLTFLLREETVGARLEDLSIEPAGGDDTHRVHARVAFVRGRRLRHSEAPSSPDAVEYTFDLVFARHEDSWKAVRGRYQRL